MSLKSRHLTPKLMALRRVETDKAYRVKEEAEKAHEEWYYSKEQVDRRSQETTRSIFLVAVVLLLLSIFFGR